MCLFACCCQMFTVAVDSFQDELNANSYEHEFECLYICEIDESKWAWEQQVLKRHAPKDCHFKDCSELHKLEGKCRTHSQACRVPETEGLVAGVSCKDFSKQNPNKWLRVKGSLLDGDKSPGKSCEIFFWTFKLIDSQRRAVAYPR